MMLSRTAASLYWLGRYVERADFVARLVEATVRLDALAPSPNDVSAWDSALSVTYSDEGFAASGVKPSAKAMARYMTLDPANPGSILACVERARDNAKAVRTALTRDAWTAINRAWLVFNGKARRAATMEPNALVEAVRAETRGFEGAIHWMMRNQATWFIRLGAAIERADNTARLLDVKYHLLLPEGAAVGGSIDRDQWTTILHTVSAVTAYRWVYSEGLKPSLVIDLLTTRFELPRSLAGAAEETVNMLNQLGKRTGLQGEADRLARARLHALQHARSHDIILAGLHEYLNEHLAETVRLDAAIARQFAFV